MDYSHLITVEPGKRSGQPCIRGMRITVRDVLEYLAGGMTVDELLADFPELTREESGPAWRTPPTSCRGQPPTRDVVALLRTRAADLQAFLADPTAAVLKLP